MIDPTDTVTGALPLAEPRWLALLRRAVASDARGATGVAVQLKKPAGAYGEHYGRAYISQFLNGLNTRPASPAFVASVLAAYGGGRVQCPHLACDIAASQCEAFARRPYAALSSVQDVSHWRACQSCPLNPVNPVKNAKPANKDKP